MQIGTAGSAYGPSRTMSRPTLGQPIKPIPAQQLLQGAHTMVLRRPRPAVFNPNVLANELRGRLAAARAAASPELVSENGLTTLQHFPAPMLVSEHGNANLAAASPFGGHMLVPDLMPASTGFAPSGGLTADPASLLARARLAALMQQAQAGGHGAVIT